MRLNRIGNVERFIEALRNVDHYELKSLNTYQGFGNALDEYVAAEGKPGKAYTWTNLLTSIADMIEEAMERG